MPVELVVVLTRVDIVQQVVWVEVEVVEVGPIVMGQKVE
tara:strand:- start:31 stop:147 length:117 start_codon:yes stop_codon:yes gene_type:complete